MHKLISLIIGSLVGIGFALMLNKIHDDAERIEALENGIERFLCFEAETGGYNPGADLAARCAAR